MTPDWRDRAACRGEDLNVFFPATTGGTGGNPAAATLCARCPVRPDCLDEALTLRETYGFRGGKSGDERALILRRRSTRADRKVLPVDDICVMLRADWACQAIATRLDVHVDSVRRVRRTLLKKQGEAA